jgi:membrane protein YdbS with pleckstrin-like domain
VIALSIRQGAMMAASKQSQDVRLLPSRLWIGIWIVTAAADIGFAVFLASSAVNDPVWAVNTDAWGGVLVFVVVLVLGQAAFEISSIRTEILPTHLAVRRGLIFPWRRHTIPLRQVTRVRAYPFPSLRVTVGQDGGATVTIANSMTEVIGELPEIEFEEGNHAGPIVLMRQIKGLVEERAAASSQIEPAPLPR